MLSFRSCISNTHATRPVSQHRSQDATPRGPQPVCAPDPDQRFGPTPPPKFLGIDADSSLKNAGDVAVPAPVGRYSQTEIGKAMVPDLRDALYYYYDDYYYYSYYHILHQENRKKSGPSEKCLAHTRRTSQFAKKPLGTGWGGSMPELGMSVWVCMNIWGSISDEAACVARSLE